MAFSSGTFSRLHDWTTDRDAGIKISASRTDAEFDGIATGLTTCILKDGTQTLTAMIPFTLGLSVPTDKKIQLRDSAIFINSSGDGQLDVVADTEIELTAPTVDVAASTAVTIATPSLIITDNTTDEPIVQIKNTHNGTTAGELRFVMDKGAAGADGDDLGTISFYGDDAGQNQTAFAKIVGEVSEADETDEAGKLSFFVAESDGTNTALTAGLILEGEHATDGEVDVTIGAGAASTTTISGVLNMGGREIILDADADTSITADTDDQIDFKTSGTDRMLILSGGNTVTNSFFKGSNATDKFYNGTDPSSGNWHEFNSTIGNEQILAITNHNTGTDNEGVVIRHVANTNNTSSGFINCANDVNGNKFAVKGNGDVQSATNSYGSTSDERLKSNIIDANSQWDDIKQLRFRNFKKYDTEDLVHLGLIAQEAEKISPNIVSDSKPSSLDIKHDASFGTLYEDGDTIPDGKKIGDVKEVKEKVKDIKYSVLYMKAVKALQEAMTRIETLESKVKALEEA